MKTSDTEFTDEELRDTYQDAIDDCKMVQDFRSPRLIRIYHIKRIAMRR